MTVTWSRWRTVRLLHLLLHACAHARLKVAELGMIISCLYLCSITNRSIARSVTSDPDDPDADHLGL
jgi:hypothetical protein